MAFQGQCYHKGWCRGRRRASLRTRPGHRWGCSVWRTCHGLQAGRRRRWDRSESETVLPSWSLARFQRRSQHSPLSAASCAPPQPPSLLTAGRVQVAHASGTELEQVRDGRVLIGDLSLAGFHVLVRLAIVEVDLPFGLGDGDQILVPRTWPSRVDRIRVVGRSDRAAVQGLAGNP
eukprot:9208288-Pyramimonas_sp.AAC.1